MPTAILVDGGFFLKRFRHVYPDVDAHNAKAIAKAFYTMTMKHLEKDETLYRIFFYDCPPLSKKAHNPVDGSLVNFETLPGSRLRVQLHAELKKLRKVALRLGYLSDRNRWIIKPDKTKKLLRQQIQVNDLTVKDVTYDINQKGVDMRIGLDIAALSLKQFVKKIILISGDSDFVPAAKFARREGIDFVLDPMWNNISPMLFEHIDGLKSTCPRPVIRATQ